MNFNKATKNLLSEMDMSTNTAMAKNTDLMSGEQGDSKKIQLMRKMGADEKVIARWKTSEARGISFESFLIGLIDEIKNGAPTDDKIDVNSLDDDDDMIGGFVSKKFTRD